jgi:hypothetical protein
MSFGALLALIILAILLYFLFKIGIVILIIVIALIVLYYIYELLFAKPNYNVDDFNKYRFKNNFEGFGTVEETVESGNNTGHQNYLYIPMHDYHNETNNLAMIPNSFDLPSSTSEYCVSKQLEQTGDLELALANCVIPRKTNPVYAY